MIIDTSQTFLFLEGQFVPLDSLPSYCNGQACYFAGTRGDIERIEEADAYAEAEAQEKKDLAQEKEDYRQIISDLEKQHPTGDISGFGWDDPFTE